jgi:hypothetical protein
LGKEEVTSMDRSSLPVIRKKLIYVDSYKIRDYILNNESVYEKTIKGVQSLSGNSKEWNNEFVREILGYKDAIDEEVDTIVKATQIILSIYYGKNAIAIDGYFGSNSRKLLLSYLKDKKTSSQEVSKIFQKKLETVYDDSNKEDILFSDNIPRTLAVLF